jgi:hypothetical protein
MEMAGKLSDRYFCRWQAKIVTTINILFEEKRRKKKNAKNYLILQEN